MLLALGECPNAIQQSQSILDAVIAYLTDAPPVAKTVENEMVLRHKGACFVMPPVVP